MRLKRTSTHGSISMISVTQDQINPDDMINRRLTILKEEPNEEPVPQIRQPPVQQVQESRVRPKSERRHYTRTGYGAHLKDYHHGKKDAVVKQEARKMALTKQQEKQTEDQLNHIKNRIEALKRNAEKTQKKQRDIETQKKKTIDAQKRKQEQFNKKNQDAEKEELELQQKKERVARMREQRSRSRAKVNEASQKRIESLKREGKQRKEIHEYTMELYKDETFHKNKNIVQKVKGEEVKRNLQEKHKETKFIKTMEKVYKQERNTKKMHTTYNKDLLKKLEEQEKEMKQKADQANYEKDKAALDLKQVKKTGLSEHTMSGQQTDRSTGRRGANAERRPVYAPFKSAFGTTLKADSDSKSATSRPSTAAKEITAEQQEKIDAQRRQVNRLATPKRVQDKSAAETDKKTLTFQTGGLGGRHRSGKKQTESNRIQIEYIEAKDNKNESPEPSVQKEVQPYQGPSERLTKQTASSMANMKPMDNPQQQMMNQFKYGLRSYGASKKFTPVKTSSKMQSFSSHKNLSQAQTTKIAGGKKINNGASQANIKPATSSKKVLAQTQSRQEKRIKAIFDDEELKSITSMPVRDINPSDNQDNSPPRSEFAAAQKNDSQSMTLNIDTQAMKVQEMIDQQQTPKKDSLSQAELSPLQKEESGPAEQTKIINDDDKFAQFIQNGTK